MSQERCLVREERCDPRPSFDLFVESFEAVGRSEPPPVDGGHPEDGKSLGDVLLEPGGKLRSGFLIAVHDVAEPPLSLGRLVRIEDTAEAASTSPRNSFEHGLTDTSLEMPTPPRSSGRR